MYHKYCICWNINSNPRIIWSENGGRGGEVFMHRHHSAYQLEQLRANNLKLLHGVIHINKKMLIGFIQFSLSKIFV
jgi:hypothetical protein